MYVRYTAYKDNKSDSSGAQKFCASKGADLATIVSSGDMALVNKAMAEAGINEGWIGAYQENSNKDAKWLWRSGLNFGFTKWNPNEPNNWEGREDCAVAQKDKGWNDVNCAGQNVPICEERYHLSPAPAAKAADEKFSIYMLPKLEAMSFENAQKLCKERNGNLATILNNEE